MRRQTCGFSLIASDGWRDMWRTECGKTFRIDAPEEVGMSFAPSPTAHGQKYCTYCGGEIVLSEKS